MFPGEIKMDPKRLFKIFICMIVWFGMASATGVQIYYVNYTATSIPSDLGDPPTVWQLKFKYLLKLKVLATDSFVTYYNVERLFVEWSAIETIEAGAFNGLLLLQRLKFTVCPRIVNIPSPLLPQPVMENLLMFGFGICFAAPRRFEFPYFRGFLKVYDLDLTATRIIDFGASILPPLLRKLYMPGEFVTEMPDFSTYTPFLTDLSLANNPIGDFPMERLAGLDKLNWMRLSACSLTKFHAPPTLVSLETLRLNDNQISNITGLSALPKLKALNLENNQLTSLPDFFHLPNFGAVNANTNRWACDKDLCWMWALLYRNRGAIVKNSPMTCSTPTNLAGRNFRSLSAQDLGCELSTFGK